MNRKYSVASLGNVCRFEKGTSPTMKTEPGEYPLVVTAAFRRTSADYQFCEPAVCIPLISSTGHGNAAIHRIHYQEGKFALANLMVAVIPLNPTQLDAKFLWRYLSATKEEKLVTLMQGTANVSLKENDLMGVTIPLPPLEEQQRIVFRLDAIENRLKRVQKLRQEQGPQLTAALRSVYHKLEHSAEWARMGDVAPLVRREVIVEPEGSYPELGIR